MSGKYKDIKIDVLPSFNDEDNEGHTKIRDGNNSAYVDGFFSFLSSKALNDHRFLHGVDFYGSFLAIQEGYTMNFDGQGGVEPVHSMFIETQILF